MRSHVALALAAYLLLWACGSSAEPAPATTAPPTTTAPATAVPPSTTIAPTPTAAADPARAARPLTPADRTQLGTAIREGRRAAHEGHFAEALVSFEAAVALQPSSGRVRCETAYVAFQAGELARAETHLRVAVAGLPTGDVVAPRLRVPTATCLYNAGLVYEARDRFDDARAAYTRSIALRPNTTVEGRLDALVTRLGPIDPSTLNPGMGPYTAAQSFDAIAADVRRQLCEDGAAGFSAGEIACDTIETTIRRASATGPVPIEAAVVALSTGVPAGGSQIWQALIVRSGDHTHVDVLAAVYSAGIFGMSADAQAAIEARDVLPGGTQEIVVTVGANAGDSDMGSCDYYESDDAATIVCSTDVDGLRCVALPVVGGDRYDHDSCSDMMDGDDDGDYDEPLPEDPEVHEAHGYALTLTLENGRAVFARDPTSRGQEVPPILGDTSIAELLGRHDLAWPDHWAAFEPISG